MKKLVCAIIAVCLIGVTGPMSSFSAVADDSAPASGAMTEAQQAENKDLAEEMKENAEEAKKIIVARVNGVDISMFSLVRSMNRVAPKYFQQGLDATPELNAKIKKEALDNLIFQELAIQKAQSSGIKIEDSAVDKVVSNVKESLGSEKAYQDYLKEKAITEAQLREQIIRGQQREIVVGREVYGKVKVAEDKIKAEYEKMKDAGKLRTADNLVVDEIFMMKGQEDAVTKKRAEEILKEVQDNNNEFGKLILDGTFINRRIKVTQEKNPALYEAIKKMEIGQLSDVIKDRDSYHIIKLVEKDFARDLTVEEATSFIENRLRVKAQDERWAAWEEELKKDAKIEIFLEEVEKKLIEEAGAKEEEK